MTREEAKRLAPIIKAFSEGQDIQQADILGKWFDMGDSDADFLANVCYRIKPEPREWWLVHGVIETLICNSKEEAEGRGVAWGGRNITHVREVLP